MNNLVEICLVVLGVGGICVSFLFIVVMGDWGEIEVGKPERSDQFYGRTGPL